jgi:hypothetical protein
LEAQPQPEPFEAPNEITFSASVIEFSITYLQHIPYGGIWASCEKTSRHPAKNA